MTTRSAPTIWSTRRPTPIARTRPDASREGGFAGGFDGLVFGLLIFVVGTLLVAAAWGVVDTKMAASTAAEDAARTYVEAPSATIAARRALQVADSILSGSGRSPAPARVTLLSGSFGRCQRITIEVRYPSPLLLLPFVGDVGSGLAVTARHSELVDPYRTGLPGAATCA